MVNLAQEIPDPSYGSRILFEKNERADGYLTPPAVSPMPERRRRYYNMRRRTAETVTIGL